MQPAGCVSAHIKGNPCQDTTEGGTRRKQTTSGVNLQTAGMTDLLLFRMWAFLRLKDTVVKPILDDAADLEHPTHRVRDNLLLPMSTLATWVIFGVGNLSTTVAHAGLPVQGLFLAS